MNKKLVNELFVNPSNIVETQTDMAYWDMSALSYNDIVELTGGEITDPEKLTSASYSTKVKVSPAETEEWDIVKALDDEETDTQALAFQKDADVVIAYRGSQEFQDWVGTDPDYLVLGANREPSKTRAKIERVSDSSNIKGTLSISQKKTEDYEQMDLKNPFDVAADFAEEVKAEFPNAEIDTTGHSLGGALATYARAMASYQGETFVRQTTTYAAPNVYGMLPEEVQEQVDQDKFRNNTINYTDGSDTFGTLNDRYPQIGEQFLIDNKKVWMGNHSLKNFDHLFVSDGVIRLTPESMIELAGQSEDIYSEILTAYRAIEEFDEDHDDKIREIQNHFENQIGSIYDRLEISDVKTIIDKFAKSNAGGKAKFYDTESRTDLLIVLEKLQKNSKELKENLNEMAAEFEKKDEIVASWLKFE